MKKIYEIKSNTTKGEVYSVVLTLDESGAIIKEKSSCDCKHGSFYRFTQKNMAAGRWKCKHMVEAIKMHENKIPDEIEKEVKNGNKGKKIESIF